jgi:tetratricopeptide (TPR) repeat protein
MLETIQEFALERLAASGEATLRRTRHAECLLSLLTRGQEHPFPQAAGVTTSTAIVERVEGELDNVRAALAWFVETAADENAARLLLWAFVYWLRRGPLPEIRASFEQILERELPGKLRQWLLWALCQIARLQADGSRERSAAAEYLALSRRLDPDGPLVLEGLRDLGLGYGLLGDFERMAALHEEALTEAQARGYRDRRVTILINNLGYCELMLGNPARSREFARRALDLAGELGDDHDRAGANAQMAAAFLLESRHNEARPLILDALHLARESESRMDVPEHLECLAICEAAEGRARRATRLLGAAETLRAELGVGQTPEEAELFPLPVAELRSELGDDEYDAAFAEGAALGLEQAIDYACAR